MDKPNNMTLVYKPAGPLPCGVCGQLPPPELAIELVFCVECHRWFGPCCAGRHPLKCERCAP